MPLKNLNCAPYLTNKLPTSSYNLYGLVNHSGTLHSGHYTASVQNPSNRVWSQYNDKHVTRLTDMKNIVTQNAYLGFYVRQDVEKRNQ